MKSTSLEILKSRILESRLIAEGLDIDIDYGLNNGLDSAENVGGRKVVRSMLGQLMKW